MEGYLHQLPSRPQRALCRAVDVHQILHHAGGSQYAAAMASSQIAELGYPMAHRNIVIIQYGDVFAASLLEADVQRVRPAALLDMQKSDLAAQGFGHVFDDLPHGGEGRPVQLVPDDQTLEIIVALSAQANKNLDESVQPATLGPDHGGEKRPLGYCAALFGERLSFGASLAKPDELADSRVWIGAFRRTNQEAPQR